MKDLRSTLDAKSRTMVRSRRKLTCAWLIRAGILRSPSELRRRTDELIGVSRSFGGSAVRPSDAVCTGDVDGFGRVGDGRGDGMVGSEVSWDSVWLSDDRGESVGCERDGSRVGLPPVSERRVGVVPDGGVFVPRFWRGGDGGCSSIGGSSTSCEVRMTRDGGRGVLWSYSVSMFSFERGGDVFSGGGSLTSSAAVLFVRLCFPLPTRLIRRIPPMNRLLPLSFSFSFSLSPGGSDGGRGSGGRSWCAAELCASLERSSTVSRVVVELFLLR